MNKGAGRAPLEGDLSRPCWAPSTVPLPKVLSEAQARAAPRLPRPGGYVLRGWASPAGQEGGQSRDNKIFLRSRCRFGALSACLQDAGKVMQGADLSAPFERLSQAPALPGVMTYPWRYAKAQRLKRFRFWLAFSVCFAPKRQRKADTPKNKKTRETV